MKSIMKDITKYDKNDIRRNNNKKRDFFMRTSLVILGILSLLTFLYIYLICSRSEISLSQAIFLQVLEDLISYK